MWAQSRRPTVESDQLTSWKLRESDPKALGITRGLVTETISVMAEGKPASPDYTAWPLMALIAALLRNTCLASPWAGWSEPAVVWVALIGPIVSCLSSGNSTEPS